jgi:spore coat polysaccharide biosynthesis protein SpsF (cytidylyltransferase family)
MLNTLGIIEVRQEAQRSWSIGRKLGGKSILERVVRRVTDSERLDQVVVLCANEQLASVRGLVPPDVEVVAAQNSDSLSTAVAICRRLSAKSLVHVSGENPFVDPELIDRLVNTADAHPNCDYIGYCRGDGRPAVLTHMGMLAEWCSVAALCQAARGTSADRRHLTASLYAHPERFNVRLLPVPVELDREDLRLRLDGEEDWEHAHVIYEALGHDEWDWRQVVDLLHGQPALRSRMAHLNQTKQCA